MRCMSKMVCTLSRSIVGSKHICAAGMLLFGEGGLQLLRTRDWMHWTCRSFWLHSAACPGCSCAARSWICKIPLPSGVLLTQLFTSRLLTSPTSWKINLLPLLDHGKPF